MREISYRTGALLCFFDAQKIEHMAYCYENTAQNDNKALMGGYKMMYCNQ